MKHRLRSFTLIEMLIVIVIIGILAAALVPRLQSMQGRARDGRRKVDGQAIFNGATIYQADYGFYPGLGNGGHLFGITSIAQYTSATGGVVWIPALSGIMTTIPKDPLNSCTGSWGAVCTGAYPVWRCNCVTLYGSHTYRYGNVMTWPNNFDLTILLENPNDPDRCEVKPNQVYGPAFTCVARSWYSQIDTWAWKRFYNINPNYLQ